MRNEKKLLVKEIEKHLDKSAYVFFTDFRGVTVGEVSSLRKNLRPENGEFHVVKKSLLKKATDGRELPMPADGFEGQIAIVVGGKNPAGVAKVLRNFYKASKEEKLAIRGGILDGKLLTVGDVNILSELPGMDALRAQFLSLLEAPATKLVRTLNAVPQNVLNVLQARAKGQEN
jgi:large subunit ribosomal protein L10